MNLTKQGAQDKFEVITTFVLQHQAQWYFVTAGHIIEDLHRLVEDGWVLRDCRIVDTLIPEATSSEPAYLPIDNLLAAGYQYEGKGGDKIDFALVHIPSLVRIALEANGVEALDESGYLSVHAPVACYGLVGVPRERVMSTKRTSTIAHCLFPIERLSHKDTKFTQTDPDLFYGKVDLGDSIKDLDGVSGGPIFGFWLDAEQGWKYGVVGIQSKWTYPARHILATPVLLVTTVLDLATAEDA